MARGEDQAPYQEGYRAGVAAAGARLVGVVAARLGDTHPVLEAMVIAVGKLAQEAEAEAEAED